MRGAADPITMPWADRQHPLPLQRDRTPPDLSRRMVPDGLSTGRARLAGPARLTKPPMNIKPASAYRWDVTSLGEVMLRLDPGPSRIHTARSLHVRGPNARIVR